jgi:hypothetical protein
MKDCWQILGIRATVDAGTIRRSYLDLIKKYHPDTVFTPEQKRRDTIRCAEINNAYEDAIRLAQLLAAMPSGVSTETVNRRTGRLWYSKLAMYSATVVGFFIIFVMISFLIVFVTSGVKSLSDTNIIRVVFASVLTFAISTSIIGFCMMGIFDMLIAFLFPSKLLLKVGLERYEKKLIWFSMVIFNLYILYFTGLGNVLLKDNDKMSDLYVGIWRVCGAGTVPFIFALDWIKDVIKYARVKKHGFALRIVDN